jgi:hypothetical protein
MEEPEEEPEEIINIWVIFDGFGVQIFYTCKEQLANFNNMIDSEYNKSKCSIALNVPGYNGVGYSACSKNITTGVITVFERPRDYKPQKPHIPAD